MGTKSVGVKKLSERGRKTEREHKVMKAICMACYIVAPVFFALLYLLMTMSYEDILHTHWNAGGSVGDLFVTVYHYLPRLGEFYQHLAMWFMDVQTTLGFGLILRLIDALICVALIYLLTVFVLKRRPRLVYKDALIYVGFFVLLMFFETSEVFMYRFSYVHNYILALLATVGFLLPYRLELHTTKPLALIGMILLGFLFGISNEVTPIAVTVILIAIGIIRKITTGVTIKQFLKKYRLQIAGLVGIFLGLLFFYLGAGIGGRTNGGYGAVYEYVHLTELFSHPRYVIATLIDHFWYNLRYLAFALALLLIIIFSAFIRYKQSKPNQLPLHLYALTFCILFLGASSLIKLHDDIYTRFLAPVYVAIFISILTYLNEQLSHADVDLRIFTKISCAVCLGISILMTADMTYAMLRYHIQISPICDKVIQEDQAVTAEEYTDLYMQSSPIFHFRQLTPANWGDDNIYMKYDN